PFTIIPLVMFAEGARNLPLSSVGLISFLTPSVKFVVAVAFFGEEFSVAFRWAFPLIWVALVLYILDEYGYSHKLCRVRKVCSES
ncbi:MAG: hypothetical protein KDD59_14575, partial [Bdellovibrionales bacterium]|nr:hypothetical protein [Bdellovibrionales bacterium]